MEAPAEERRPARSYEDDEPVSPIFEQRRPARPAREDSYQSERRPAQQQPQRRQRVYQDDYQDSGRTQSRRGFTPDVPSFMKKK